MHHNDDRVTRIKVWVIATRRGAQIGKYQRLGGQRSCVYWLEFQELVKEPRLLAN